MSVTTEGEVKIDSTSLNQGVIKIYGNCNVVGDGSGGDYFGHFLSGSEIFSMFPGRVYWTLTAVGGEAGGALAGPVLSLEWIINSFGALKWLRRVDATTWGDGHSTTLLTLNGSAGLLPNKWFSIDYKFTGSQHIVQMGIYPNTNGVSVSFWFAGMMVNDDYISRHGLFLPS
jgi:hypothetical protein